MKTPDMAFSEAAFEASGILLGLAVGAFVLGVAAAAEALIATSVFAFIIGVVDGIRKVS